MKRDAFLDQVEIRHAHLFCGLGGNAVRPVAVALSVRGAA